MKIEHVDVVTAERVIRHATVTVEYGLITDIKTNNAMEEDESRGSGRYLIPGLIDLHSDANEKAINPRPNAFFPKEMALMELDKLFASCGVTTVYHCAAFSNSQREMRDTKTARSLVESLHALQNDFRCRTKVHVRYDIVSLLALPVLHELVDKGQVDLLSFMDHTPGQGQFKTFESFNDYCGRHHQIPEAQVRDLVEKCLNDREQLDENKLKDLASACRDSFIPLASHDDDTPEKVDWAHGMGISISEFPVSLEAARAARKKGLWVVMGSPNLVMGQSTNGNLKSREAWNQGLLSIFCSDYSPMTLLHAVFILHQNDQAPLSEAVKLVSLNPAMAAGIEHETGSIEPGKRADLVLVDTSRSVPRIMKTYVAGKEVYSCH